METPVKLSGNLVALISHYDRYDVSDDEYRGKTEEEAKEIILNREVSFGGIMFLNREYKKQAFNLSSYDYQKLSEAVEEIKNRKQTRTLYDYWCDL